MGDIYPQGAAGQPAGQRDEPAGDVLRAEADAARQKLGGAVESVKGEAAHFAEAAKEKTSEKVDHGKEALTGALGDFADAIRRAGEELSEKDQTMAARLVSQAAEGLETLSRTVSEKRPEDMLNAVRDFGRSNPTAFLAGSVLAGLALGRFARSSGHHQHAGGQTWPMTGGVRHDERAQDRFAETEGFAQPNEGAAYEEAQAAMAPAEELAPDDRPQPQTGI